MTTPDNHKGTSERKIDANRRNARRSTGPRTVRGKGIVSRNAIKHGLVSGQIVNQELGEKVEDFRILREQLIAEYAPVGRTEHLLVERIAICWWRLRRAARAESGEITKQVISAVEQHEFARSAGSKTDVLNWVMAYFEKETGRRVRTVSLAERAAADQTLALNLRRTRHGIVFLKTLLNAVREAIQENGFLPDPCRNLLVDALGMDHLYVLCDDDKFRDPARRQHLLDLIDERLRELDPLEKAKAVFEVAEKEATCRSANVLPDDIVDKLVRYETHIARQLYRAMDQLERIQRQRGGESVPAPLRFDIGK